MRPFYDACVPFITWQIRHVPKGAASTRLEPYRPWFLGLTAMLLGAAFVGTYRRQPAACADGSCAPASRRTARIVLWIAAVVVAVIATFPSWVTWLA
ncbi:MAG: hypothetical protein HY701_11730 [Gemmatimonadetes bacterium]|nr:hypothetical protein [Gemmatimonadota bacterium]